MSKKKTIQFHIDTLTTVLGLSENEPTVCIEFLKACLKYDETGKAPMIENKTAEVMFEHAKSQLDEAKQQYERMVKQKRDAAIARWKKENGIK